MILITGATGSIGRPLVRILRREGVAFRTLVRDLARADGDEAVRGDFDDPDSLAAALTGVDRLFLCSAGAQPVSGPQPMIAQELRVIDAAARAGVRRIVKVSVLGARAGGLLAEGAHAEIETHLEQSGLEWVLLHPNGFMQNFRTGAGTFTASGEILGAYGQARVAYIDCADIAACAAVLLRGARGAGERLVLTGPQALSHTEIAAALTRALGIPLSYRDLSPDAFAEALVRQGIPEQFATDVAVLQTRVAAGSLAGITDTVAELTGRPATTFEDFLARERDRFPVAGR